MLSAAEGGSAELSEALRNLHMFLFPGVEGWGGGYGCMTDVLEVQTLQNQDTKLS